MEEKIKSLNLTTLEETVLINLTQNLYAEPGFSDWGVNDISNDIGENTDTIKGVIGSLVKKGICYVDKNFPGIVYLSEKFWYLHPSWGK